MNMFGKMPSVRNVSSAYWLDLVSDVWNGMPIWSLWRMSNEERSARTFVDWIFNFRKKNIRWNNSSLRFLISANQKRRRKSRIKTFGKTEWTRLDSISLPAVVHRLEMWIILLSQIILDSRETCFFVSFGFCLSVIEINRHSKNITHRCLSQLFLSNMGQFSNLIFNSLVCSCLILALRFSFDCLSLLGILSLVVVSSNGRVLPSRGRDEFPLHCLSSIQTPIKGETLPPPADDEFELSNVSCDGCEMSPLIGLRYYCSTWEARSSSVFLVDDFKKWNLERFFSLGMFMECPIGSWLWGENEDVHWFIIRRSRSEKKDSSDLFNRTENSDLPSRRDSCSLTRLARIDASNITFLIASEVVTIPWSPLLIHVSAKWSISAIRMTSWSN